LRVSPSSEDRISSALTSGSVLETGIVHPALATGAALLPGWTSTNMSFSPVLGRSSAVALVWMRFLYWGSIWSWTIATPFLSETLPISPTCTPDTRTDWPWPGVTACAVENSALSV
jgi:hypothetical protein